MIPSPITWFGAFVVMGFHHPLEHGIENLARLLGIAASSSAKTTVTCLRSPSRAAFEVRILSTRCLGVGFGRREPRRGMDGGRAQTCATSTAEVLAGLVAEATGWARERQRGPAFGAEAPSFSVLTLAAGTLHPGPPDSRPTWKRTAEGD